MDLGLRLRLRGRKEAHTRKADTEVQDNQEEEEEEVHLLASKKNNKRMFLRR
jgi:hypothetical protein